MSAQELADAITWSALVLLILAAIGGTIYFKFFKKAPPPPPPPLGAGAPPPAAPPAPPTPPTPPAPQPAPPQKKAESGKGLGLAGILWMFLVGGLLALGIAILRFKEVFELQQVSLPLEIEIGMLIGVAFVLTGLATPKQWWWGSVKIGLLFAGFFILAIFAGFSDAALGQMQKSFTDHRSMAGGREESINCEAQWVTVPAGQTSLFQPKDGCPNLRWERQEGAYITHFAFDGSNGRQEATWRPGRPPAYRGAYVTSVAIYHDNREAVSYRFFYVN